jgi:hypothetical protein
LNTWEFGSKKHQIIRRGSDFELNAVFALRKPRGKQAEIVFEKLRLHAAK